MTKRIALEPMAELGRAYAALDEGKIEIGVSGVMGVLKAWLLGKQNLFLGNIAGGRLVREIDLSDYYGVLITQSGRQMFFGRWREGDGKNTAAPASAAHPYSPLPDLNWQKITSREFPSNDERVKLALSCDEFFSAFKKHGYYLFAADADGFALALPCGEDEALPFPLVGKPLRAGEYVYVRL